MMTKPPDVDAWVTLGLSPATATVIELKHAYARLLKQSRPDRDPEGFMRLRAAYEAAQAVLKDGALAVPKPALSMDDREESSQVPAMNPAPEISAEVRLSLETLRQAVASKMRQKVRIAWAAYDEAAEMHELNQESRWLMFIEVFAGSIPLLADACTDERLLEHIKSGEMRLLRLVTDLWSRHGDAKRLDEFSVSLSRQRQLADSENGALAMVVIAIALGAWNPEQAARLAQRAFPRLPTARRSELAERVDFETMLGRLVAPLPQPFRIPWIEVLRDGEPGRPWREIISRDMIVAILRYCGPQWPGLAILNRKLKPASWLELKEFAESLMKLM